MRQLLVRLHLIYETPPQAVLMKILLMENEALWSQFTGKLVLGIFPQILMVCYLWNNGCKQTWIIPNLESGGGK